MFARIDAISQATATSSISLKVAKGVAVALMYADETLGASGSGNNSTSITGHRSIPAIVRCNFLSVTNVRQGPITGEFLLDPTWNVPGSRLTLAPLAPGETRKNLVVKVDYDVDIDVWVKSSPAVCCA